MEAPVLAGIITHSGHRYCREECIHFLNTLTYPCLDFLFVTDGGDDDRRDILNRTGLLSARGSKVTVRTSSPVSSKRMDRIVTNRNMVRRLFLEGSWEWLFSVDSDTMGPEDTIEAFLQHQQPLVAGSCLGIFTGKDSEAVIRPALFGFDKPGHVRQLLISEILAPQIFKLAVAGLGCCLIHRKVIARIEHRKMSDNGGEDTAFFKDARKLGYDLWCDTRVKCRHQKYPAGDPRNDLLDLSLYRLPELDGLKPLV